MPTHWMAVAGDHAEGRGRFADRIHVNALMLRLVWDLAVVRLTWARRAADEVASWGAAALPDDETRFERLIGETLGSAAHLGVPRDPPAPRPEASGRRQDVDIRSREG